jgi:predicted pyridoxine 5'-phosphate oxidase superfamily flavin-nucleotide-binding protein
MGTFLSVAQLPLHRKHGFAYPRRGEFEKSLHLQRQEALPGVNEVHRNRRRLVVLEDDLEPALAYRKGRLVICLGNLGADDRVALILMDYPGRARLKILGHAGIKDVKNDPALAEKLATPGYKAKVERAMIIHLEAFDWNCPQHITPRFTEAELGPHLAPVRERLAALETENATPRARLANGAAATPVAE